MCTEIVAFLDGTELWSLEYDGSNGVAAPKVKGSAPKIVLEAIAALEKGQASAEGVDCLYEAAARLGLELVGFRHDETLSSGEKVPIFMLATRPMGMERVPPDK